MIIMAAAFKKKKTTKNEWDLTYCVIFFFVVILGYNCQVQVQNFS